MESDSFLSDIISTNIQWKRVITTDNEDSNSDFYEIVFSLRKQCKIISDNKEECKNDCEINLISLRGMYMKRHWKYEQNIAIFTNF